MPGSGNVTQMPSQVQLGQHSYTVVAQRHAYLEHMLGPSLAGLADLGDISDDGLAGVVKHFGDRAHDVLRVFIPELMPKYEFRGFGSHEAFEADNYEAELDKSPPFPQIKLAFETAFRVNELDVVKALKKILGPEVLAATWARLMDSALPAGALPISPPAPDSTATPSSPGSPTTEEPVGSPEAILGQVEQATADLKQAVDEIEAEAPEAPDHRPEPTPAA